MTREEIIERLRRNRDRFEALGVSRLSLFGSTARDQAGPESDIDVVVDTPDGQAPGLFRLARISEELERILGRPADVISRSGLERTVDLKRRVAADIVDVF